MQAKASWGEREREDGARQKSICVLNYIVVNMFGHHCKPIHIKHVRHRKFIRKSQALIWQEMSLHTHRQLF